MKRGALLSVLLIVSVGIFFIVRGDITISPVAEGERMALLEEAKKHHEISPFISDGCSGNVSGAWETAVREVSDAFPAIRDRYKEAESIPFEYACEEHDRAYHAGSGGYAARLMADDRLRHEILEYAIKNVDDIRMRTGLETNESAIFLYEKIAELVYRGVRIGGAPCSGQPYAWGYGYGSGVCE